MTLHEAPEGVGIGTVGNAVIALLGLGMAGVWALRAANRWLMR